MLLVALAALVRYGRNIPFAEDWLLVPPLTGNEPNLFRWLWAQNNEHRIPFPRLILVSLLRYTNGDFRVGMLFNIVVLGVLAAAMIRAARRLRGGRAIFADALFPIALLHLGNWENLFWSWQLTQVVPVVLALTILLVLVDSLSLATPGAVLVVGVSLMLLPLSGANGLLLVPILAAWLFYRGAVSRRDARKKGEARWASGFLMAAALAAICLAGLYLVGFKRSSHDFPSPDLAGSLLAAARFLALGLGPAARSSWALSIPAVLGLLVFSVTVAVLGVLRNTGQERLRAIGLLLFLGDMVLFALAMGWARAEVLKLPVWGGVWPIRYVLLAVPALFAVFFIWELYGPQRLGAIAQTVVFVGMFVLIPFNTIHGLWYYDQYLQGAAPLEQDLRAGLSVAEVGQRNREYLFHWMDPSFGSLRMLREANIGLFGRLKEDPVKPEEPNQGAKSGQALPQAPPAVSAVDSPLVTQVMRYIMPEAGEVYLVWGLAGWNVAPEELRPAGTQVRYNVMHTPMEQSGDAFVAKLAVPAGTTIRYCFLVTKKRDSFDITWPLCEGDFLATPTRDSTSVVRTDLTLALVSHEIRYHLPEAREVYLLWGLKEGWHMAPEELRPAGTLIRNERLMQTPMLRTDDGFTVNLRIPANTSIVYGFLITERRGLFNLTNPVWDGDYREVPSENGVTEVKAAVSLNRLLPDVFRRGRYFVAGAGLLLGTWLALYLLLGFAEGPSFENTPSQEGKNVVQ